MNEKDAMSAAVEPPRAFTAEDYASRMARVVNQARASGGRA